MKLDFSPCLSRLYEKGGKRPGVPAHHKAEEYMDQYLEAAGIAATKKVFCSDAWIRRIAG